MQAEVDGIKQGSAALGLGEIQLILQLARVGGEFRNLERAVVEPDQEKLIRRVRAAKKERVLNRSLLWPYDR